MKFLHAAVSMNPSSGFVKQLADERRAAEELRIEWSVWLLQARDLGSAMTRLPRAVQYALLRVRFYVRLVGLARQGHRIVLRYSPGDPFLYLASHFLGSYFTVHHTLEEQELAGSRFPFARSRLMLERWLGRSVVSRARGLVCMTPEIARHQLARTARTGSHAAVVYPNGARFDQGDIPPADSRGHRPEVIFVASYFFAWHGLEALLDSISQSEEEGVLHIVGAMPDSVRAKASADSRVVIHGTLELRALEALIGQCWVGLSSFDLASKGLTEACTLKVRDFLRLGLPVYAGHRDSALPSHFDYFRQGRPNWPEILAFARSMRAAPRAEVATAARPWIDKTILLERLVRSLERIG